jgi:AraC-like DNA-binding protein
MARAFLEEGRTSVTDIAFLVGFGDMSSFSRAFRRWTGLSPRGYSRQRTRRRAS